MRPGLREERAVMAAPQRAQSTLARKRRRADEDMPPPDTAVGLPSVRWGWWLSATLCGLALWGAGLSLAGLI